jgi:hypothetical protein
LKPAVLRQLPILEPSCDISRMAPICPYDRTLLARR